MVDKALVMKQRRSITHRLKLQLQQNVTAYLFLLPWIAGLLVFTLGPMLLSIYYSFTDFALISKASWIGLGNYRDIFMHDDRFTKSLKVTLLYVVTSVPLRLAFALLVAMLMNRAIRGIGIYRAVIYLPSLLGGSVAVSIIWRKIFDDRGLLNSLLSSFHVQGINWIADPRTALYTLTLLSIWQFGSAMIIFLAGLKQVPASLYEAADIDGASGWRKFISVTFPMLSPVVFFNLVMQTMYGFIVFTQAYVVTQGGPMDSTLFYALYLYQKGFNFFQMGYASALAWILLVVIGICTALLFASSKYWVHYETGEDR